MIIFFILYVIVYKTRKLKFIKLCNLVSLKNRYHFAKNKVRHKYLYDIDYLKKNLSSQLK